MSLLLIGTAIAVVLAVALVVDLRDRKRGGQPLARGNGLRDARLDDTWTDPNAGDASWGALHSPPGQSGH